MSKVSSDPNESVGFEKAVTSRLDKLEGQTRWRFYSQLLFAPVLTLAIGSFFNYQIEKAKAAFQQAEVDTKRVEAVKGMLPELFSDRPERSLIAEAVVTTIVDEHARQIIQTAVRAWVKSKIDSKFSEVQANPAQATADISAIASAAQDIGTPSARVVEDLFVKPDFYTVVVSEKTEEGAISWAKKFQSLKYPAQVYLTTNSYFTVVIGVGTFAQASPGIRTGKGYRTLGSSCWVCKGILRSAEQIHPRENLPEAVMHNWICVRSRLHQSNPALPSNGLLQALI